MRGFTAVVLAVAALSVSVVARHDGSVLSIPLLPVTGNSTVQFTAGSSGFDGPKANFYNDSVFQWWYFDAVADDLSSCAVIQFFANAAPGSFGPDYVGILPFTMSYMVNLWPNGTVTETLGYAAEPLIITTVGEGSSGVLNGSGYSWHGAPDLSRYNVEIEDPINDVYGSFKFESIAPAHGPCGPVEAGSTLLEGPHLGWANAIPDAKAYVNITMGKDKLEFAGAGYHDSNWGDIILHLQEGTWYWGHGRLGPYSLVWFDYVDPLGAEHTSGYIAEAGKIVAASCSGISVRPTGQNKTWPPLSGQGNPSGFYIVYDMGKGEVLEVEVENTKVGWTLGAGDYSRWIGTTTGGMKGKESYKGIALYEWMGGCQTCG